MNRPLFYFYTRVLCGGFFYLRKRQFFSTMKAVLDMRKKEA